MLDKKRTPPAEKTALHLRNKHRERYNFSDLTTISTELAAFVIINEFKQETIDFFNPEAVKALNKALLKKHYGVNNWDLPANYLIPPIPGRADYIHNIADLLMRNGEIPTGKKIKCLDIGVGANAVYPIIGNAEYQWSFVGTDIDPVAIASVNSLVETNPQFKGSIEARLQTNATDIFQGIIQPKERFDVTICNPPFHASQAEAEASTQRKLKNLTKSAITKTKTPKAKLNFGGQPNELWCEGGEEQFIWRMIVQSKQFATSCCWFSTLVSKESNLNKAYKLLKKAEAITVKTLPMAQGNKQSRILVWSFLTPEEQEKWNN